MFARVLQKPNHHGCRSLVNISIGDKPKEIFRMVPTQITKIQEQHYHDQHLDLDFGNKTVLLDSEPLTLTRKEYNLLAFLIEHSGELVSRETLLLRVWGYSNQIHTRTLDVHILRLRRKLGEHSGKYIETVVNAGYRFQPFRGPRLGRRQPKMFALGA
jgi:DNA-binding response OmpR family regulator